MCFFVTDYFICIESGAVLKRLAKRRYAMLINSAPLQSLQSPFKSEVQKRFNKKPGRFILLTSLSLANWPWKLNNFRLFYSMIIILASRRDWFDFDFLTVGMSKGRIFILYIQAQKSKYQTLKTKNDNKARFKWRGKR